MSKINDMVTNRIIDMLEEGTIPWAKPFDDNEMPTSWVTGKPYQGVNKWLLPKGEYLTFQQVQKNGGKVKKGSKSYFAVYWRMIKTDEIENIPQGNGTYKERPKMRPLLRYFNLFEVSQCEGIEYRHRKEMEKDHTIDDTNERSLELAKQIIYGLKGKPNYEEGQACYIPSQDTILMPKVESFRDYESFYGTFFHELIHATGHPTRLNREGVATVSKFGDSTYSFEELVAELGASMLSGYVGFQDKLIENNASYIQSWIRALKNDNGMIITASSASERAVNFILDNIDNVDVLTELNENAVDTILQNVTTRSMRNVTGFNGLVVKQHIVNYKMLEKAKAEAMKDLSKEGLTSVVKQYQEDLDKVVDLDKLAIDKVTKMLVYVQKLLTERELFMYSDKDDFKEIISSSKGSIMSIYTKLQTFILDDLRQKKEAQEKLEEQEKEKMLSETAQYQKSDLTRMVRMKEWVELYKETNTKMKVPMTFKTMGTNVGGLFVQFQAKKNTITLALTPRDFNIVQGKDLKRVLLLPPSATNLTEHVEKQILPVLYKQGVDKGDLKYFRNVLDMLWDLRKRVRMLD